MAIGKWIPFTGTNAAADNQNLKPEAVQVISSADAKKFGLENFGNTCYANSVIQALYFCRPFRDLLLQYADPSAVISAVPQPVPQTPAPIPVTKRKPERKQSSAGQSSDALVINGTAGSTAIPIPSSPPTLFSALRSLFLFISKNPADKGTVAPRAFIDKLKDVNELFRSTMHQDAHEFLNYLLNRIVEEIEQERKQKGSVPSGDDLIGTPSPPTVMTPTSSSNSGASPAEATLVHRLFEGVLTSETRCLTCEAVSSRDEAFLDLSIDIEQNSSVTACLRQFSASEMLCQKNKFFCDSCCDLQEAEKRMKIKKLPNVLALHLKRFKYQEDVQKYIKLAYRVAFPFELRLFNTVDDTDDADRLFELFAIVVHIGNGPHHGHYISIIKTMGSWVVFDDDAVDTIKESDISRYFGESNSGSAYVLYYQAVDIDLSALGLRLPEPEPAEHTQATAQQPMDLSGSPLQAGSPALPPGLSDDPDATDINEPPLLVNFSASHSQPLSDQHTIASDLPPHHLPSQLLKVTVPSSQDLPAAPSGNSPPAVGLFRSLRHSSSTKIRASMSSSENRKSLSERIVRPQTSPILPKTEALPNEDSNNAQPEVNRTDRGRDKGKDKGVEKEKPGRSKSKDPERKASAWFKRISIKRPSAPTADHRSPTNMISSPREGHSHNALDPSALSSSVPEGEPSSHTNNKHPWWGREPVNGYESPSAGSSSSVLDLPSQPASLSAPPLRAPPLRATYSQPSPSIPTQLPADTMNLNVLSGIRNLNGTEFPVSAKIPPRPASVGATSDRAMLHEKPIPPVPPIPPLPSSPLTRITHTKPEEAIGKGTTDLGDDSSSGQPPSAGPDLDTDFPGADYNTGDSDTNLKRTKRKLSLSAPKLGFGKKDKEKHKSNEKEKERGKEGVKVKPKTPQLSPIAFALPTMTTRT